MENQFEHTQGPWVVGKDKYFSTLEINHGEQLPIAMNPHLVLMQDHIEEVQNKYKSDWQSIDTAPLDEGILATDGRDVLSVIWDKDNEKFVAYVGAQPFGVANLTHWMPFPEPPKPFSNV